MTKHVHADKIMQFAEMVAAGHPSDKLVQVKKNSWVTEPTPCWFADQEYRVARGIVEGRPVFAGSELYDLVLHRKVTISDHPSRLSDVTGLCWAEPPLPNCRCAVKPIPGNYQITHKIGDASVTVCAPSHAECESLLRRLEKPEPSPDHLSGYEKMVVSKLRSLATGLENKTERIGAISWGPNFGHTKYSAEIQSSRGTANINWIENP